MAVDSYLVFTPYNGSGFGAPLKTETTVVLGLKDLGTGAPIADNTLLHLSNYSVDVDQTVAIGSGNPGRISFNPLSVTKTVDILSPTLFQMCAAGTPFAKLDVLLVKTGASSFLFLQYTFKLVVIATLGYSPSDESPQEVVTFEYGDMQIRYQQQGPNGGSVGLVLKGGWNAIKNVADLGLLPI